MPDGTSAQTKLRAWVARKPIGTEFTTTDVRAFLKQAGFDERQSGGLLVHMIRWWKLVERIGYGRYRRI